MVPAGDGAEYGLGPPEVPWDFDLDVRCCEGGGALSGGNSPADEFQHNWTSFPCIKNTTEIVQLLSGAQLVSVPWHGVSCRQYSDRVWVSDVALLLFLRP